MVKKDSEKYIEAKESLREELWPTFESFVDEYYYYTVMHYGRGYVAYKVLASLVEAGWRPTVDTSAKPTPDEAN